MFYKPWDHENMHWEERPKPHCFLWYAKNRENYKRYLVSPNSYCAFYNYNYMLPFFIQSCVFKSANISYDSFIVMTLVDYSELACKKIVILIAAKNNDLLKNLE